MVIEACYCNWGIAGVDRLPAHSHYDWALVRHNGREFRTHQHNVELNPGMEVLDAGEDVRIWVSWKDVARA